MEEKMGFWPILFWLAWMGFCFWSWRQNAKKEQRLIDEGWSELARRTGLVYDAGGGVKSLWGIKSASSKPGIRGEYCGHPLSLTIVVESVAIYDSSVPVAYTVVWLKIRNKAGYSFTIQEKGILSKAWTRAFAKRNTPDRNAEIDPRFKIITWPPALTQSVAHLVQPLILQRTTMQINRSPFFWTSASKSPAVKLEGSDLVWQQYDVVTNIDELDVLLKQLCNLADLVEESNAERVYEK